MIRMPRMPSKSKRCVSSVSPIYDTPTIVSVLINQDREITAPLSVS
jgi:hypothetical protein